LQSEQALLAEIVAVAVETQLATDGPKSVNSKLILVPGIVLDGMLGIVMVLLTEFFARVRESLSKEKLG